MNPEGKPFKKVLHVIDSFGTGGAETWLLQVAKYAQKNQQIGLRIDFLATGGLPSIYDEAVLQTGSRIFYIKYSMKNYSSFRRSLLKIFKEEEYDAIHDHQDFISGWHFLLGNKLLPSIRVSHLHNPYNFVHNYVVSAGRWFSFRTGRILTAILTSKITGTSNSVMDEYGYNKWPFKTKRVAPVYCGFDVTKFEFNDQAKHNLCKEMQWDFASSKIALFVGRIGHDAGKNQKNPDFALAVAKELVSTDKDWKFLFVGFKGAHGEEMEDEIAKKGLDANIKFLGLRNDVAAIMSAASVLVFPSLWEGLGMVAVEAQASGLPIIMSDSIPGEAIVVNELVTVKSLEKGAGEWVATINGIVANSDNRRIFCSRVAASPFSIEQSVANLMKLYSGSDGR